jgi:hypothetical protein
METIGKLYEEWVDRGKPKQSPAVWISRRDSWLKLGPEFESIVNKLPVDLGRDELRQIATQTKFKELDKFLATMIWGYGDRGYGAYRVSKILLEKNSVDRIIKAHDFCRNSDPINAYRFLQDNSIRGLGPSFGTKFISFMTPIDTAAPILDSLVSKWLIKFGPKEFNLSERHFTTWNAEVYMEYVDYISAFSNKLNCHAETIEQLIFESASLKFSVGNSWLK